LKNLQVSGQQVCDSCGALQPPKTTGSACSNCGNTSMTAAVL